MKTIVTYQSKTGFTKQYAEWISQALSCEMKEASQVTAEDIAACDLVIHGGWVMGGRINGLDKIKGLAPRKFMVFGVGSTAPTDLNMPKFIEDNHLSGIPTFYYEGGMDPKKMGFMGKMMVKMVTKQTPTFTDHTDQGQIRELVELATAE